MNPPAQHLLGLTLLGLLHQETGWHRRPLKIDRPPDSLLKATAATGGGETKDHNPPGTCPHCQTEALKVTGVQSPSHLLGHPNQTIQTVLGIHDGTGGGGRKLI